MRPKWKVILSEFIYLAVACIISSLVTIILLDKLGHLA